METPQLNPANPAETTADDPNAHEPMTHNPRGPSVTVPEGYMGAAQQEQDVPYPLLFAPATEKNDSRPAVLLILVPGVFLHPSDYGMLCARIRDASKDCPLALWFCIPSMSWRFEPQSVQNQVDDALESALQTAIAKGFEPLVLYPGGRNENVFVAMHSAAIMGAAGFPLKRSAGILALGSMLMPSENINMDAYTYPRPLMHIWGERDGQFSLIKASLGASRALARDLPLGFNVISSVRPLLVVPGMNHAQFSDGIVRKERGDLDPNVSQDEALTIVAQGILHFLIVNCAHMGIPTAEVSNAVQVLASMTEEAARFIDPPAVALGRASPRKLVQLSKLEDNKVKPLSQKEETDIMLLALSCGAEAYPKSSRIVEQLAHPGEVKLAREFAIHAQYQVLKNSIASEVTDTVRVAATVHVLKDTFLRSQSEVIKTGLGWGIHVHILLYWEGLSSTYSPLTFVSPRYALKLKDGKQLLMVGGGLHKLLSPMKYQC